MENKFNYQIITEKDENGRHIPDYDKLIANASCEEEAAKWRNAKEHLCISPFGCFFFA